METMHQRLSLGTIIECTPTAGSGTVQLVALWVPPRRLLLGCVDSCCLVQLHQVRMRGLILWSLLLRSFLQRSTRSSIPRGCAESWQCVPCLSALSRKAPKRALLCQTSYACQRTAHSHCQQEGDTLLPIAELTEDTSSEACFLPVISSAIASMHRPTDYEPCWR